MSDRLSVAGPPPRKVQPTLSLTTRGKAGIRNKQNLFKKASDFSVLH